MKNEKMLFLLSTPDFTKLQSNTTKVRVHLRNGIAEIFDQHEDLIGKVENDLLEIETNFENKLQKFLYILQDAVFIVSNKGLEKKKELKGTGIYVYARRVCEVNQTTSIEDIKKQYEQKQKELENLESENQKKNNLALNSKTILLTEEVEFLRRAVVLLKKLKS